jgi:Family of unknown function (DUF5329)
MRLKKRYLFEKQYLARVYRLFKLLTYVENLAGAKFVRNSESQDAKKAAEHLRMKREKAGSKVKTALDFIEKVASKSYFSGDPYQITFANVSELDFLKYFSIFEPLIKRVSRR